MGNSKVEALIVTGGYLRIRSKVKNISMAFIVEPCKFLLTSEIPRNYIAYETQFDTLAEKNFAFYRRS